MPAPRKRLTTLKLASQPPALPRAQNNPKSITNPNYQRNPQLVENKATSQKSIPISYALPSLGLFFPTPHALDPTPPQINRHTFLLEIAVTLCNQRTSPFLIATKTKVSPARQKAFSSHSPLATRHFFCNSVPTKTTKEPA
jgi:hypothetical protein